MRKIPPLCVAIFCAAVALPACQIGRRPAAAPVASAASSRQLESLPAQTLAPGACGLFLWTREETPKFIFFRQAGEAMARIAQDQKTVQLALLSESGTVMGAFMTHQSFADKANRKYLVELEPGEEIDGGIRTRQGRLRVTGADGWEEMIPVSGLAACQPS